MADPALSAEIVRQRTSELLGMPELDLSYVTDELVAEDASVKNLEGLGPPEGIDTATLWGNNTRYGAVTINGVTHQCYWFNQGGDITNQSTACGSGFRYYATTALWHHTYQGKCQSGRERWSFSRYGFQPKHNHNRAFFVHEKTLDCTSSEASFLSRLRAGTCFRIKPAPHAPAPRRPPSSPPRCTEPAAGAGLR